MGGVVLADADDGRRPRDGRADSQLARVLERGQVALLQRLTGTIDAAIGEELGVDVVGQRAQVEDPLVGGDGTRRGSIVIFNDLTEVKRLEDALEQSRRLAALGELAASLAHEKLTEMGEEAQLAGKIEKRILNLGVKVKGLDVDVDGEIVVKLKPVFGYLHRNHEKIGERNTYLGNMPFTDRLDYVCSLPNNHGYAMAIEQLLAMGKRYEAPTYRAEVIRVLMVELTRILNHLVAIGFLLNDLGAYFTPLMYSIVERELILDFFEAVTGTRLTTSYTRIGGLYRDLYEGFEEDLRFALVKVHEGVDDLGGVERTREAVVAHELAAVQPAQ